jgi:hypothetical protein
VRNSLVVVKDSNLHLVTPGHETGLRRCSVATRRHDIDPMLTDPGAPWLRGPARLAGAA